MIIPITPSPPHHPNDCYHLPTYSSLDVPCPGRVSVTENKQAPDLGPHGEEGLISTPAPRIDFEPHPLSQKHALRMPYSAPAKRRSMGFKNSTADGDGHPNKQRGASQDKENSLPLPPPQLPST